MDEREARCLSFDGPGEQGTSEQVCEKQPKKNTVWTPDTVATLFALRRGSMRAQFVRNNSISQIKVWWEKLTLSLSLKHATSLDSETVKSKHRNLQHEFNAHKKLRQAGNDKEKVQ